MLARWSIRDKLLLGIVLLTAMVSVLTFSGFQGAYAYRGLARSISRRANELPLATDLARSVGDLRVIVSRVRPVSEPNFFASNPSLRPVNPQIVREEFRTQLLVVKDALRRYREQLSHSAHDYPHIDNNASEWQAVSTFEADLDRVARLSTDEDWLLDDFKVDLLADQIDHLLKLAEELPSHLQERMHNVAGDMRGQYRTWIILTWVSFVLALGLLLLLAALIYYYVFLPMSRLLQGSRRVAGGDFTHRIELATHDEMAELAQAMNDMTGRFCEIRDDLDRRVQDQTRELIQGERLASVGFLAAGVAHEINNPLAAIAMCAESLEMRLHDIMQADDDESDDTHNPEITVLRNYLRTIQDEAFRCKGITEKLLNFARMGDKEKQEVDLAELVEEVIAMIRHIGKYKEKQVEFTRGETVRARVNSQEIKQVVLNLIVNGLDSLDPGGHVQVFVKRRGAEAELLVKDNGCGMTAEVREHLFEPFFTRRRDGQQGTGLGLSISYRIVADHHGRIEPASAGPGQGSQFRVTLPLVTHEKAIQKFAAAA